MWKYFIAGLVLGGLTVGLLVKKWDHKVADENAHLQSLRVSIWTRLLVETCLDDEFDPALLTARLEPVGYQQLAGSQVNSVHFAGGMGGRILYSKSERSQFCNASLQTSADPDSADLCETAIRFHRSLRSRLRQAELEESSDPSTLETDEGFVSVQTYDEVCANSAEQFSWSIAQRDALFDVRLRSVTKSNARHFLNQGPLRAAGYRFSISRRLPE